MDHASAFSSCVSWNCTWSSLRLRYGWCRINCEFISEIRLNSHSPILEMSLKDVSAQVMSDGWTARGKTYPSSVEPLPAPSGYVVGILPFCRLDIVQLQAQEQGLFVESQLWHRSVVRRPELMLMLAVGCPMVEPSLIVLHEISTRLVYEDPDIRW